jgi:hypothetical protein
MLPAMTPLHVALLAIVLLQSAAPDLSATWTVDAARSTASGGATGARAAGGGRGGGLGLGASPDQLTIRTAGKVLTVEERHGTTTAVVTFTTDGRRTVNKLAAGRNAGKAAVYVSTWTDGRLVTTIAAPGAPGSGEMVTYTEVRYLDGDGSLIAETTMAGRPNKRTAVYTRGGL